MAGCLPQISLAPHDIRPHPVGHLSRGQLQGCQNASQSHVVCEFLVDACSLL